MAPTPRCHHHSREHMPALSTPVATATGGRTAALFDFLFFGQKGPHRKPTMKNTIIDARVNTVAEEATAILPSGLHPSDDVLP